MLTRDRRGGSNRSMIDNARSRSLIKINSYSPRKEEEERGVLSFPNHLQLNKTLIFKIKDRDFEKFLIKVMRQNYIF